MRQETKAYRLGYTLPVTVDTDQRTYGWVKPLANVNGIVTVYLETGEIVNVDMHRAVLKYGFN